MMVVVRASGLGVSSTSMAHRSPGYGLAGISGQDTSASGMCPLGTRPPIAVRIRRSDRHHGCPACPASLASRARRAASTARGCASRPNDGREGAKPRPVASRPVRVSQHHAGPGPSRPVSA
jgi:hypothetical protein